MTYFAENIKQFAVILQNFVVNLLNGIEDWPAQFVNAYLGSLSNSFFKHKIQINLKTFRILKNKFRAIVS